MKTGRRLLAMLLVLAMLVSNLPVGAIAAEFEELAAEPTEAVTETEQPTEAAEEKTDAPETTAAPTEPVEETTEAAVEETEAPVVAEESGTASEKAANEAVAAGECGDGLTWTLDEDGVLTISGEGAMENFANNTIPWYEIRDQILRVEIQDGVTTIGQLAFYNVSTLTSVTIPASVTSIGNSAFSSCTNLTDVTIPDGVTSIGGWAFDSCTNLTNVTIPDSVNSIGAYAFYACASLTGVTIPEGVTSIGNNTFYGCKNLTDATIPDSVTSIGRYAFGFCSSLTSVTIPDGVTYISDYVFYNCKNLGDVTIPDSVTGIGNSAFNFCASLTGVTIPDGVTDIGDSAFSDCDSLTSVTIPGSVISIGRGAFADCDNLTGIWVCPENESYCSDDSGVLFTKDMTELIQAPSKLSGTYIVPDGVTSIGDFAFGCCISLTGVTIPDSVTNIGYMACYYCDNLTDVMIPESVANIDDWAFADCSSLNGIQVAAENEYYCNDEFGVLFSKDMTVLIQAPGGLSGSYRVPGSVRDVRCFSGCAELTSIYFEGDAPEFGSDVFNSVTATLYYPAGNATWTEDVLYDYGADVIWVAYGDEGEEENLPYLSFANIYENENGLFVDTSFYGREFVNPYGMRSAVAFFLNEYVDGEWVMTNVEVEAVDGSISLELLDEAVDGADYGYTVTTNVAGVTSGVCYEDVTMNVGTWPHHFHFTTEANTDNDNTSLIYELDADHLSYDTDALVLYAAMFHEDFTWSDVRLVGNSDSFADIEQVSDDLYRITLYGVARKHVADNGYVNLEIASTQTDNNTGEVNENGYMWLPIFLAPNPGLIVADLHDDGDGLFYESEYHSYMYRIVPGNVVHQMYYLRQWDYTLGEMVQTPVPVDELKGDYLVFDQIASDRIREGEPNAEYFTEVRSTEWGHSTSVYIERDGRTISGVNAYTDMGGVAYFSQPVMSEEYYLLEYYVNPDGENVLYFILDEDYAWEPFDVIEPPALSEDAGAEWATMEDLGDNIYQITLDQSVVDNILRGNECWLTVEYTSTSRTTGFTNWWPIGIALKAHEEDIYRPSYLTWGWLENSGEGFFEGEWHDGDSFTIVPGDVYFQIYYLHTWDEEQGCYVETPVPYDELYCDSDNFTIEPLTEDIMPGEANADCFVRVDAAEWDVESEIGTYLGDDFTEGVWIATYLPHLGFYSSEDPSYDTYLQGEYIVDPEAEENAFYVVITDDYWVIDNEPSHADDNMGSLMVLEKRNDTTIKVTLTQEGVDAAIRGEEFWPGILFTQRNTEDGRTEEMFAGGLRVRANDEDIVRRAYLTYDYVWLSEIEDDFWAFGQIEEGPLVLPKGKTMYVLFYLNTLDEATGTYVSTPVHVTAGEYLELATVPQDRIYDGGEWGTPAENGEYYCSITSTEWDKLTEVSYTMEDGTVVRMEVDTSYQDVHFFSKPEISRDNVIHCVDGNEMTEFYVGLTNSEASWSDVYIGEDNGENYTFEKINDSLYKITLTENAKEFLGRNMNYVWDEFRVWYTLTKDGETVEANVNMTYFFDFVCLRHVWDDGGLYEYKYMYQPEIEVALQSGETAIAYLITWDFENNCRVWTPIAIEDLVYDSDVVTIEPVSQDLVRGDQVNGEYFFTMTAVGGTGQETEISCAGDDADGVNVTVYRPQLAFYSEPNMCDEAYIPQYYENDCSTSRYTVTDDAGVYVSYLGWDNTAGFYDEDIATITDVAVDADSQQYVTMQVHGENLYKVTLTQDGLEAARNGETVKPVFTVSLLNGYDEAREYTIALDYSATDGDVIPDETGLYFRFLEDHGEGFFDDPERGDCFGTNIGKYDQYSMYFFLKVWDEAQGQYVEIPVHPEYDGGIILNRIENVRDDQENGEYFYFVSIADDALDTDQKVWAEYAGTRYAMTITSGLHNVAVYSTEEPSHDTRLVAPVDVDPFGENVVYLATNGDWVIEDVRVHDWASEYLELEALSDTVWSVTLSEAGINENMTQWVLDMGMDVDIRNVEDPNWTESHFRNVAFSRENLQPLAYFRIDGEDWIVLDGGYLHSWDTGEDDGDDEGNIWDVWDTEALTDLPAGLTYDYTTNTLTMDNYSGERMQFDYAGYDENSDTHWQNLPTDTLTIELTGDSSVIAQNDHAFHVSGGLNVVFTGDGALTLKTVNDYAQDEEGNARVYNTVHMNGGDLTIEGDARVIVEIDGWGDESCWDENGKVGERAGNMTALAMDHGRLYIRDNGSLETVIPEDGQRNGSEDVGEDNAIWGERFPGGFRGIADVSLAISGGTLVTQSMEFGSGRHDDGSVWTNNYTQTGGDVTIQAKGWNGIHEELGIPHAHYEGLTLRDGITADISGGTLTVNVEATDAQLASSTYYEAIAVRGGTLAVSGDAEITVAANHDCGNLIGVFSEPDQQGSLCTGRLRIYGGSVNVNGSTGEGNGRSGIYLDHETEFTMTGGTVNSMYADFMNHGHAHISGGTFNIGGMYLYTWLDEYGDYPAWVTGFHAGGPEFIIDGGEINVEDGHFIAGGMVTMNGGIIDITNGSLEVGAGFAFNDGEINIANADNELTAAGHNWASLWIGNYLSIGGSDIENANPTLTIDHNIWTSAVIAAGTYHQMGGTVNITHYGEIIDDVQNNAIYVKTEFDENGNPMIATDEDGNPVLDEQGDEIILSGTFLMNDGELNVLNAGDYDADLIIGMQADPYTFVQFLGGATTFVTAQVHWDGEAHIGGEAIVELKDSALITNHGHVFMDGGTLKANDESAVCLGMAEMEGGRMELNNALMLVNGGFHFNNGEILIDNTAADIDPGAVWTSLGVNTYFAIGNPEDPGSNPSLIINHNLERNEAVQLNGTMHLMAGTVDINVPVTRAPGIFISDIILDDDGNALRVDEEGNPMGGEFLQNGGVLNINAAEDADIAGIIAAPNSAFFMNGGEANFNGTNMVMSGKMFLYDRAVMHVTDGILRVCENASLELDYGQLNMTSEVKYGDDVSAVLYGDPGSHIQLNNGTINVTSGADSYNVGVKLCGTFNQEGGAVNIEAPQIGLVVQDDANISGGTMNILVHGVLLPGDNGEYTAARGLIVEPGENPDPKLTISGGEQFITAPDGGQHDTISFALNANNASIEITGGVQHLEGQQVYFGYIEDSRTGLCLAEDRVLYSLEDGNSHQLLYTQMDGFRFESYEDDDIPGNWDTEEGFDYLNKAVIVSSKAGDGITWEVRDGVLTFRGEGAMADYAAKIPAPWHMIREFITSAELDSNLTYIGSYAFSTLSGLSELNFLGEAPDFAEDAFVGVTADAIYPVDETSWSEDVRQNYGGEINWFPDRELIEVVEILTDKEVLFSGEKATLNAQLAPEEDVNPDVLWSLAEGDDTYATLTVRNNVATVTAKTITEKHEITVIARTEEGLLPVEKGLTLYPKAQSVSIFQNGDDITGGKIKADLGTKLTLTAALNPDDAEDYLDPAITWTSSNKAVADVDENGTVTIGEKTGTAKITATANDGSNKKAVVTITVVDMIDAVVIPADSVSKLVGGKTASFTAYEDAEQETKLKTSQVVWSVDPEFAPYASITTAGKLTTKVVQEAVQVKIRVASVDDPAIYDVHVITICPAAFALQMEKDGFDVTGDTIPVSLADYDAENPPVVDLDAAFYPDDALTNITWKTSSKAIAAVDETGSVTAAGKAGTVTITATDANSRKSASVKLTFGVFAETVQIEEPASREIVSGNSMTLKADTVPNEGLTKSGVTWALKDPAQKNYLTVTAAGKATAKTVYAPTEVTLVASSKDGYAEAEITLTVVPKDMGMLAIKSGSEYVTNTTKTLNYSIDKSIALTAHTLGTDAQESVEWSSSSTAVATVDASGTVTFKKTGTVKITATHADGRKAVVTLKAAALATGITVIDKSTGKSEDLTLAAGKTMNLGVTAEGVSKVAVTWSVEPAGLATIASSGKLTASAAVGDVQTVTVTARANDGSNETDSVEVTLRPQVQGIQIHGLEGELTNCTVVHDMAVQTIQLRAETFPEAASRGVTWKSSNAKIASIDENGEITCVKPGTVTITATAKDGSGKKATFKLTLVKKVTSLTLSQNEAVLAGGKSLTLKAVVNSDATDKSVIWSMTGDTAYVTLSSKGVLKASAVTAPKKVTVTAAANDSDGQVFATCEVTVYPATTAVQIWHKGELTTTRTTLEVWPGQTIQLEGVSVPDNAAGIYTWKSSGAAATVEDGRVTGVTAGKTVTITCTAADGTGKKTTVKVKVVSPELSLWTYPIGSWGDPATVSKLVSAFKAETGIQVNVEYLDYMTGDNKVDAAIEAGTAPDLILEGPERLVANWGARGEMVNIADLFDSSDKSQIYANVRNACFADETTAYQYPLTMTAHGMAINKTVFEAAGAMQYIDEATHTWKSAEAFFAAVDAVYEYTGTTVGAVYCRGQGGDQGTRALVNNLYGGTYTNAAHTAYTWNTDANIRALKALYDCEGIRFDAGIAGGDEIALFYNGRLNMAFCWNIMQQQNPNMAGTGAGKTLNGDEILFMAFPADGDVRLQGGIWGFGIFDNGDQTRIEAAKIFIKYFCDSEATADAVKASGYFPVRSNVTDGWTDNSIVEEYNCLMPMLGDYYQVTGNWGKARTAWFTMLQMVSSCDGSAEAITDIAEYYTEQANAR